MEILTFELRGKMAHFRKYFANNTAFSYSIPPRTTLSGIIAAAMGWPKDSYYERFADNDLLFGIRVLVPIKKSFHRINFLSIKSKGNLAKSMKTDFRGDNGRIQTPFELITPTDLRTQDLAYQVFLTSRTSTNKLFDDIKTHFLQKNAIYNLSLGAASFQASIQEVYLLSKSSITEIATAEFTDIHTALPSRMAMELAFDPESPERYSHLEEELLPGAFKGNFDRELIAMDRVVFSTNSQPIRVKTNEPFLQLRHQQQVINLQFINR